MTNSVKTYLADLYEDLESKVKQNRDMLIKNLERRAQNGKLDLVRAQRALGQLKNIKISKNEVDESRCLNGEVQRLDEGRNYCSKLLTGK